LPNAAPPQMPDALGRGMRSGKSTALRGWTRCGITETLRALITLKGPQWSQRFQWSQWFSGRAQTDEPVDEQAIEDWLRAITIRPDYQDSLETRGWPRYAAREGEMAMPLLTTKLYVPRARAELVSRPRLTERLNEGVTRKLTLVSAPAGFGKTTLLSEWASHFGLATEARRKDPKTTPGLTPLQIRRVCGGVL